jgi:hypothetical protein
LSFLGPNILLNTVFSNTLIPRSTLIVSNQVSHPYKTTGKAIFLLTCWDSTLEDKTFWTEW